MHSEQRILTTHCGSLPRPADLLAVLDARNLGEPGDERARDATIASAVETVVHQQTAAGIDIVNDGEHSKTSFSSYVADRLGGLTPLGIPFGFRGTTRDRLEFPGVYEEQQAMYAARPSNLARPNGTVGTRKAFACTGPIRYTGHEQIRTDIDNLRRALAGESRAPAFMTALSPSNVSLYYPNQFYASDEEYLYALADAMHEEYQAIVDGGFVLQLDDPQLATHYDRHPELSIEECRAAIALWVEVINYSLRGIPPEKVRFHTCYSTNVAPRVNDFELRHFIDLMLQIHATGYSFEASNPRHEHEWQVWETVALPADKVLIPGVVSHCITLVEHPELVAQRIGRFAGVVGRERVIASNDCGFATASAGDNVHPDVVLAKLRALTEGARLASAQLWVS